MQPWSKCEVSCASLLGGITSATHTYTQHKEVFVICQPRRKKIKTKSSENYTFVKFIFMNLQNVIVYKFDTTKNMCIMLFIEHIHSTKFPWYTVRPNKKETRFISEISFIATQDWNKLYASLSRAFFSSFIWYQTHNDISMHEWKGTI